MKEIMHAEGLTDNALERICDAHWNHGGEGVSFRNIHQHNTCNHTLSGTINVDGIEYGFIIDSGDWGGTVVREWGPSEDVGTYEAEPIPLRTFLPANRALHLERPTMYRVYLTWRAQPWFQEKERAYNYDRHFQPGGFIEGHYSEWAASKGLRIGYEDDLPNTELTPFPLPPAEEK